MWSITINERVENIKGNEGEINLFIEEYKPFIAACVEKATGRYVRYGEDDELSIAMMAFVEAIKVYDSKRGSFLSFAQSVIQRRLIDYFRKEKRHSNIVSLNEYFNDDDEAEVDLSVNEALDKYSEEEKSEYRRMELQQFKNDLLLWDISLFEVAEASPKHEKTRKIYKLLVQYIASRPAMINQIKTKKYLPTAEIEKGTGISRKKIDRARKYIIAVILIITGDYEYIKDYVDWR
jgi:RNA polymerase sigma factor